LETRPAKALDGNDNGGPSGSGSVVAAAENDEDLDDGADSEGEEEEDNIIEMEENDVRTFEEAMQNEIATILSLTSQKGWSTKCNFVINGC
jgi:hypothetical protein